MAETQSTNAPVNTPVGYGYAEDSSALGGNNLSFGLNPDTFLRVFKWIPNGGANGAEQEALDVLFTIGGVDKSYRIFPLVKVFGKNQEEITDPTAPEFKDAQIDLNAKVNHILGCFVDQQTLRQGMNRPINTFKEFCTVAAGLLPPGFDKTELDIFLQYQWQISEGRDRTYLEVPKKMKYGRWLNKHLPGEWKAIRKENPLESDARALFYQNSEGLTHPFVKNGWFMLSPFANQQKPAGDNQSTSSTSSAAAAMNAGVQATTQPTEAGEVPAQAPIQSW